MTPRLFLAAFFTAAILAANSSAHEFWIEPKEYQVQSGAPLVADFRNGQEFSGSALAYFSKRSARFELVQNGKFVPVQGRMGDVPALQTNAPSDGLLVILQQTEPSTLKYSTWEKFQIFADHKDFPNIQARHQARGLPENGFTERYTRFVKALVAVGHGRGTDVPSGMETEFVAITNPYTDNLTKGMQVQLLFQGRPRGNAQIEVFEKAPGGEVTISLLRSDPDGRANIQVRSGNEYLLDAVVLREMPEGSKEVWESLWAGLTFAVP